MMIEHCDFHIFQLVYSTYACFILYPVEVLYFLIFHFVNEQNVTVDNQMDLLGPCRAHGP